MFTNTNNVIIHGRVFTNVQGGLNGKSLSLKGIEFIDLHFRIANSRRLLDYAFAVTTRRPPANVYTLLIR